MIWEKELLKLLQQTKEKTEESPEAFIEWFSSLSKTWQGHIYRQLLPRSQGFIPNPEPWINEAIQVINALSDQTVKRTYYIKFIDPRDAELLDPTYFVARDIQTHCPKCGNVLYLPIQISTDKEVTVTKPMGEIFRPFPRSMPHYVTRDEEPKISIGFQWSKDGMSPETRRHLVNGFPGGGLAMIDEGGYIELQIDGFSREPIECETCNPQSAIDFLSTLDCPFEPKIMEL